MKNHLRKGVWLAALPIICLLLFHACKKDDSSSPAPVPVGQQRLHIYLSDDPGYFDKVLLDIRKVEVQIDTCVNKDRDDDSWDDKDRCWWDEDYHGRNDDCEVWDSLGIRPGVYDVLSLRNGTDTLLANGNVRAGRVEKLRITIGGNNSLVKDSVSYPLKAIAGQAKIIIRVRHSEWEEFTPDNFRLWLDFDVNRSIIQMSKGRFILRPVIHVFTVIRTGSLAGRVTPSEAFPVISVYNQQDTLYALPWREGAFKVRGLKEGSYNLLVNASNGYRDTTLSDIKIQRNKEVNIGQIKLRK
ncbi:DUF4382 domain-containing protein [Chitinophaga pendula]|uniref:DUF4382 domain-containing protein n=1 Tax=Chitinophaga TaxID=79328 RepID=UPI000BB01FA9|nr:MULTISPECIES: DUF4382 domain-containing protein [Chitinophaga]ASZ13530.1 hypothetical protein CK934_22535 [Chitinophaga sp. MD30]ASZ13569.1 hypothetical protein CK934_22760 [Chitinophaga sp. MD30]UCJ08838.1 DUF4382 domain-containing protein [Chitinophaga pendula]